MRVYVYEWMRVCVGVSMFGVCVLCEYVWACMFSRVCVFYCVCLEQTSSVMLRIQSSPDGADSHFIRWLTAFHVINNNGSAVVPLPNNCLYCSPTEEDEGNFHLILISLFTSYISTVKLEDQARGVFSGD